MLDKAIRSGKEKRIPYYKSKRFDPTCRPHGGCPYCLRNRMHRNLVAADRHRDMMKELEG